MATLQLSCPNLAVRRRRREPCFRLARRLALLLGLLGLVFGRSITNAAETNAVRPLVAGPRVQSVYAPNGVKNFPASISSAGDFNGDGFQDLVVGAPAGETSDFLDHVIVYAGSPRGVSQEPFVIWPSKSRRRGFGAAVAPVGDVDGDGLPDFAVGQPRASSPESNEGRVLIFQGQRTPQTRDRSLLLDLESEEIEARMGFSISAGRDLTGDGVPDIATGLPELVGREGGQGAVWVFSNLSTNSENHAVWTYQSVVRDALLGYAITIDGDFNGDGWADLAVGAPGKSPDPNSWVTYGMALVFLGSPNGLPNQPTWRLNAPESVRYFGKSIAWADTDGNGRSELFIGAPGRFGVGAPGLILSYEFDTTNSPPRLRWSWPPRPPNFIESVGETVANVGDINGDGFQDILIGAPTGNLRSGRLGRAFLFFGGKQGLASAPNLVIDPPESGAKLAVGAAGGFDLNGDGLPDFALGLQFKSGRPQASDRMDIFYGNRDPVWNDRHATALTNGGYEFVRQTEPALPGSALPSSPDSSALAVLGAQPSSPTTNISDRVGVPASNAVPPTAAVTSTSKPASELKRSGSGAKAVETTIRLSPFWLILMGVAMGVAATYGWRATREKFARAAASPTPSNRVTGIEQTTENRALVDTVHDGISLHVRLLKQEIEASETLDAEKLRSLVGRLQLNVRRILRGNADEPKSPEEVADSVLEIVQLHHPPGWTWRCLERDELTLEKWSSEVVQEIELALGEILIQTFLRSQGKSIELRFRQTQERVEFWIRGYEDTRNDSSLLRRAQRVGGRVELGPPSEHGSEIGLLVPRPECSPKQTPTQSDAIFSKSTTP